MEAPKTQKPNADEFISGNGCDAHGLRGASGELVSSNIVDTHGLWGAYIAWAVGACSPLRATRRLIGLVIKLRVDFSHACVAT